MFEVVCAGMSWGVYPTRIEALETAFTLGLGAFVREYVPAN